MPRKTLITALLFSALTVAGLSLPDANAASLMSGYNNKKSSSSSKIPSSVSVDKATTLLNTTFANKDDLKSSAESFQRGRALSKALGVDKVRNENELRQYAAKIKTISNQMKSQGKKMPYSESAIDDFKKYQAAISGLDSKSDDAKKMMYFSENSAETASIKYVNKSGASVIGGNNAQVATVTELLNLGSGTKSARRDNSIIGQISSSSGLPEGRINDIISVMETGEVPSRANNFVYGRDSETVNNLVKSKYSTDISRGKKLYEIAAKSYGEYENSMREYNNYIQSLKDGEEGRRVREYAKNNNVTNTGALLAPYISRAQTYLDAAEKYYGQANQEMQAYQQYMNSVIGRVSHDMKNASSDHDTATSILAGALANQTAENHSQNIKMLYSNGKFDVDMKSELKSSKYNSGGVYGSLLALNLLADTGQAAGDVAGAIGIGAGSGSGTETTEGEEEIGGLNRVLKEHEFCADEECTNLMPLCDGKESGSVGSSEPITKYGTAGCDEKLKASAYGFSTMSMQEGVVQTTVKEFDTSSPDQDKTRTYKIGVPAGEGEEVRKVSWGQVFVDAKSRVGQIISNWRDHGPLMYKIDGRDPTATAEGDQPKDATFSTKTQKEVPAFSPKFTTDKQSVEFGACQLIAYPDDNPQGRWWVTPNTPPDGDYEMGFDPFSEKDYDMEASTRHKRWIVHEDNPPDGAMNVDIERIEDPSHPFVPRNNKDWTEKSGSHQCHSGKKHTFICGTDLKTYVANKYAWQPVSGGSVTNQITIRRQETTTTKDENGKKQKETKWVNETVNFTSQVGINDFGYYKIPVKDKGGKILATQARSEAFIVNHAAVYETCFSSCMIATLGLGSAACHEICCDVGEYVSCQANILPPLVMTNKLKLSYNVDDVEAVNPDLPHVYPNAQESYDQESLGLGDWAKGYESNGLSWYHSKEPEQFKLNGPWVMNTPTGDVASKALIEATSNKEEWEPHRTAVVGVNSYYMPDESNPADLAVYKMSCQTGGWEALKRYQADCEHKAGVKCICDYFYNFWRGSAIGYALFRSSATGYSLENEIRTKAVEEKFGDFVRHRSEDETLRIKWERRIPFSKGGKRFEGMYGHKMGEVPWPGKGDFMLEGGLDEAKEGDIIIFDSKDSDATPDGVPRRWHAAYVERVHDGGNCIDISESDNGVINNSCEISDNWGKINKRTMCKENRQGMVNYAEEGQEAAPLKSCINGEYFQCYEEDWAKWKVYRFENEEKR